MGMKRIESSCRDDSAVVPNPPALAERTDGDHYTSHVEGN